MKDSAHETALKGDFLGHADRTLFFDDDASEL